MKNYKKYIAAVLAVSLSVSILTGCGDVRETPQIQIAFIAKSMTSNFWKTIQSGVNTAASEYNVNVTFEGPDNEEDYEEQNRLIGEAIDRQVDAIVLSAIDSKKLVEQVEKASDQGIRIVIVDSGIDSNRVESEISTDNYMAGELAAKAVLENKAETLNIGIVNFDVNSANGQQRQEGFTEEVEKDARTNIAYTVNVDSNITSASDATKTMLQEHPEINVIATFNEWTTLGVGYAIQELNKQDHIQVIGFDNNIVSIGMLETGEMDGLIVQNPYAMGYIGVETAYNLIKGNKTEKQVYTDTTFVTKDNMYDAETQKILFPLDSSE